MSSRKPKPTKLNNVIDFAEARQARGPVAAREPRQSQEAEIRSLLAHRARVRYLDPPGRGSAA